MLRKPSFSFSWSQCKAMWELVLIELLVNLWLISETLTNISRYFWSPWLLVGKTFFVGGESVTSCGETPGTDSLHRDGPRGPWCRLSLTVGIIKTIQKSAEGGIETMWPPGLQHCAALLFADNEPCLLPGCLYQLNVTISHESHYISNHVSAYFDTL